MTQIQDTDEFLQGQKDCRDGIPHEQGSSEDYTRGYAAQFEIEQIRDFYTDEERGPKWQ